MKDCSNKFANYFRISIYIFITCVLIIGCSSSICDSQDETKVVHVVLVWLKEPANPSHRAQVVHATRSLEEIPEIVEIRVGESISSERPIVDDSFDVALYMIFNSKEALEAYLVHPKHKHAVKTVFRPLASKILVYDFKDHDT